MQAKQYSHHKCKDLGAKQMVGVQWEAEKQGEMTLQGSQEREGPLAKTLAERQA